jgi:hypothetical protein
MISEAILVILPFVGQVSDLATTELAIRRGLSETNQASWAQDTNQRRAVKIGMGVAMSGTMYLMQRNGVSKKVRIATSILAAATGLVPAAINISRTQ